MSTLWNFRVVVLSLIISLSDIVGNAAQNNTGSAINNALSEISAERRQRIANTVAAIEAALVAKSKATSAEQAEYYDGLLEELGFDLMAQVQADQAASSTATHYRNDGSPHSYDWVGGINCSACHTQTAVGKADWKTTFDQRSRERHGSLYLPRYYFQISPGSVVTMRGGFRLFVNARGETVLSHPQRPIPEIIWPAQSKLLRAPGGAIFVVPTGPPTLRR